MRALTEELHTVKARALHLIHPNSVQTRTEREALSPSTVPAGEGGERQDDTGRRARETGLAMDGADAESDGHDEGRDAAAAGTGIKVDLQQFMRHISAERGAWRLMPAAEQPGMPPPPPPPPSLASLPQAAGRSDSVDDSDPLSATNVSLGKIVNATQQGAYDAHVHELAEKVDRFVEKHQGHSLAEQHARELFLGSAPQTPRVPAVRAGRIKTAAEIFIEERLGNVNIDASLLVHRSWGDERSRAAFEGAVEGAVEGGTHAQPLLTTSPRPPAVLQGRGEVASSSGGEGPKARERHTSKHTSKHTSIESKHTSIESKHSAITRGYDRDAVDGYLAQNSRTALSLNSQVSMLAHAHSCREGAQSGAAGGHASMFAVITRN